MESSSSVLHGGASGQDTAPDVLPASQYLQERLQERRARNLRPKRLRQSDFGPLRGRDDDIFVQEGDATGHASNRALDSSPLVAVSRHGSEFGDGSRRRALGAKGLDEHLDRLTKENFALKLELDHRREHTVKLQERIEAMQAQVERTEQLQDEHAELLKINSQLVEELEKRDKAVEEALDVICDLEDKIADMEERSSTTRPSTANADSGYAGTETLEQTTPTSPPLAGKPPPSTPAKAPQSTATAASAATGRLLTAVNGKTPARARREPSIFGQKKQSTQALRSVYLEATQTLRPVQSFNSLLSRRESKNEDDALNSPRLSLLSESSFPSIYSPKKHTSADRYKWEAEEDEPSASIHSPTPHLRQDSIKRVNQWINERDLGEATPSKVGRTTSSLSRQSEGMGDSLPADSTSYGTNFQSLGNALAPHSQGGKQPSPVIVEPVEYIRPFPIRTDRNKNKGPPIFGEPLLPPTPESASTRMLRDSRSTIEDDKSLPDGVPTAARGHDGLGLGVRMAPRQMPRSAELNTTYKSYIRLDDEHAIEDDAETSSETVRDPSVDYNGFPDGGSLLMGTPSRFWKHDSSLTSKAVPEYRPLPTTGIPRAPLDRRQTSTDTTSTARKPSMSRAETSPVFQRSYPRPATSERKPSASTLTSPRSYNSGSSSNRTTFRSDDRDRGLSPETYRTESRSTAPYSSPTRTRTSPSPARTLSQRAQGMFRRMSNTQRESMVDREKSTLPTLTTAPSSTYVNDYRKDVRRPGPYYYDKEGSGLLAQHFSRREEDRPSSQMRTNTTPNVPTLAPLPAIERRSLDTERKNLFSRSNSARPWPQTPLIDNAMSTPEKKTRRSSIKDAVTSVARIPWR